MRSRTKRPQLHAADSRFRWKLIVVATGLALFVAGFIAVEVNCRAISRFTDADTYKLLLQFFLITAGGGVFLAIVGNAQSVASRRQERAASVHSLERELDAAYRALKKIKRRLRAHSKFVDGEGRRRESAGEEDRIGRVVFEKSMDDLLDAQLRLETICDHIGQRDDILREDTLARIKGPLRYASGYFHDVHKDFEKGRVRLSGEAYFLGQAFNLDDFLRRSKDTERHLPPAVFSQLELLRNAGLSLEVRADALEALKSASPDQPEDDEGLAKPEASGRPESEKDPPKVRYHQAAGACLDLLSAELAQVRTNILS